jgi:hypothetical protein
MTEPSTINRQAVVLLPTEACLAWINSGPSDRTMTLAEVQREPTIYLLSEGRSEAETHVRRHYKAMFDQELNSWYTDLELWPKDRSFRTFQKFFTIQVATMVFDLGSGPIIKDEEDE